MKLGKQFMVTLRTFKTISFYRTLTNGKVYNFQKLQLSAQTSPPISQIYLKGVVQTAQQEAGVTCQQEVGGHPWIKINT